MIIKERVNRLFIIRECNYDKSFEKISRLVAIAKRDFPTLSDFHIHIVIYGEDPIARQSGIEFEIPSILGVSQSTIDTYTEIAQVEPSL